MAFIHSAHQRTSAVFVDQPKVLNGPADRLGAEAKTLGFKALEDQQREFYEKYWERCGQTGGPESLLYSITLNLLS